MHLTYRFIDPFIDSFNSFVRIEDVVQVLLKRISTRNKLTFFG